MGVIEVDLHPDALLAGLERELANFPERADAIKAEIARVEKLPRPEARVEEPQTRVDPTASYLAGLERELERVVGDAKDEVRKEIARVKADARSVGESRADSVPHAERAVRRGPGRPRKDDAE